MKILNRGRGIHEREVVGIEKLQSELPDTWRAFTNLELALPGGGREIDLIMVIEDRLVAVDLKDWIGPIKSENGMWLVGRRRSSSRRSRQLGIATKNPCSRDGRRRGQIRSDLL